MANNAGVNLSERHMELTVAVIKVMSAQIDFAKVLEVAPQFKTVKYARDQWNIVKEKLGAKESKGKTKGKTTGGDGGPKGTKRKSAASSTTEAPAAKKYKEKGPKKADSPIHSEGEEDDDEAGTKVKAEPAEDIEGDEFVFE